MERALRSSATVLVIDDDIEICEALEVALTIEGYAVRVAYDESLALEIAASEPLALIMLDYHGLGSDTQQIVERLRAIDPNVPIVLMSGINNPARRAKDLGLKRFLAKPFDINALRKVLDETIRSPRKKPVRRSNVEFSLFS
ncbi:MAG TPA: response regulator [Planctomycetota bacterium]|nr:response regulator [Planctomycetota bacterium]